MRKLINSYISPINPKEGNREPLIGLMEPAFEGKGVQKERQLPPLVMTQRGRAVSALGYIGELFVPPPASKKYINNIYFNQKT